MENASYGLTACAERNAIAAAVAAGHLEFTAIAVVTSGTNISKPCGACRQVIAEFSRVDRPITLIWGGTHAGQTIDTIAMLLPDSFSLL